MLQHGHDPVSHNELNERLSHYVTQGDLDGRLHALERHLRALEELQTIQGENIVSTQADVDALTAAVNSDVSKIQAEIAALQSANPNLDLSGLQSAVASLDSTANSGAPAGGSGGGSAPAGGSGDGSAPAGS